MVFSDNKSNENQQEVVCYEIDIWLFTLRDPSVQPKFVAQDSSELNRSSRSRYKPLERPV